MANLLKDRLLEILRQAAESKGIEDYELIPDMEVMQGDGFLSSFYKGEIKNKANQELHHVAIKTRPPWEFNSDKFFQNEIAFYTKIFPSLQELKPDFRLCPDFYASSIEAPNEFIAMEYLKPLGYRMHDKQRCLDREHLEFIFKLYGQFHALSFALKKQNPEEFQGLNKGTNEVFLSVVGAEERGGFGFHLYTGAVLNNLEKEAELYSIVKKLHEMVESKRFFRLYESYQGPWSCWTHGDCWSNNFLFKYDDSGKLADVKVLDFQLTRESSPVHDLAYFFYAGAAKTDLDNLKNYLSLYHDSLSKTLLQLGENVDEIFPYNVLLEEWKNHALMGVLLGLALWQLKLTPKETFVEMMSKKDDGTLTKEEKEKKAMEQWIAVLQGVINDEKYLGIAFDLISHACEFGVLTEDKLV